PARKVGIPDDVVRGDRQPAGTRIGAWQGILLDLHRLRIDAADAGTSKVDVPRDAQRVEPDAVRVGVVARRLFDHHLAARDVDPADVSRLQREEDVAGAFVENRRVRPTCAWVVERILLHLPRLRIEPADDAFLNARVPDMPLRILGQPVRLAVGTHIEFADLSCPRVETSELAGKLAGPPDRSIRGGVRIVWPGAERRREPLLDRDGGRARDQYRAWGVLDREMRGEVRRDRFEF